MINYTEAMQSVSPLKFVDLPNLKSLEISIGGDHLNVKDGTTAGSTQGGHNEAIGKNNFWHCFSFANNHKIKNGDSHRSCDKKERGRLCTRKENAIIIFGVSICIETVHYSF